MKPTNFVQNKEFDIGLDFDYKEVEDISSDSHIGQNIFKGRFSLKENTSSKYILLTNQQDQATNIRSTSQPIAT